MAPTGTPSEVLISSLAAARSRLGEFDRRRADDLIHNARLYGTGYSQRAFMRELIAKAETARPALRLVS